MSLRIRTRFFAASLLAVVAFGTLGSASASASGVGSGGQEAPEVVRVGIFMEHLSDIDLKLGTFQADFYMWFLWSGEVDPTKTYEFKNTRPLELSAVPSSTDDDGAPRPEILPDGRKYQVYHVQGRFLGKFQIDDYPLDDAELVISMEDAFHDSSALVYEFDEASGMAENVKVTGWRVQKPVGQVTDRRYSTTFGYPGAIPGDVAFSRLDMTLQASRPGTTLAVQSIFPLIVIVFAAMASLLIDSPIEKGLDEHWWWLATRLSLAVPAVIAAVALQLSAASGVPREGQVLLIDRIYLLSYAVILTLIAITVLTHRMLRRGRPQRAETVDRLSLLVLVPVFLAGIALILVVR